MKKTAIIGFGRFGELLAKLGKTTFDIHIVESDPGRRQLAEASGYKLLPFESLSDIEFIFLAVPISQIKEVITKLAPQVDERHVIIDLCSVKVYPAKLMQQYLTKSQLLATHPMFGPDSAKKGLAGLQVAICPLRVDPSNVQIIRDFWSNLGVIVTETTPEAHDKDSVYSQAFTYSLARIILNMHLPRVGFKTRSFEALLQVAEFSANDSEQLFHDMLFYNPYYSEMKGQLESSIELTRLQLDEIEAAQSKVKLF